MASNIPWMVSTVTPSLGWPNPAQPSTIPYQSQSAISAPQPLSNIQPPRLRSNISLPLFPVEVQLKILQYCVVSKDPIELTGPYDLGCAPKESDFPGYHCRAILRTCRLYWVEGLKLFYRSNQLILETLDYHPGPERRFLWAALYSPGTYASMLPYLEHVVLKYRNLRCYGCRFAAASDVNAIVEQTPSLKTLEILMSTDWVTRGYETSTCEHHPDLDDLLSVLAPRDTHLAENGKDIRCIKLRWKNERTVYRGGVHTYKMAEALFLQQVPRANLAGLLTGWVFPMLWRDESAEGSDVEILKG